MLLQRSTAVSLWAKGSRRDPKSPVGSTMAALGVALLLTSACAATPAGPSSTPASTPTSTPTPSSLPQPNQQRLQLSGRVTDQSGVPLSDAIVEVDYTSAGGISNPPSFCPFGGFCWLATRTNDMGGYSVEFEPRAGTGRGLSYVYALRDGYEVDVQWVPVGLSPAVQDSATPPLPPNPCGGLDRRLCRTQ